MNWIRQAAVVCALSLPVAAFAAGTASGTITSLYVDTTYGDIIYIELSGLKSGNPACGTGKAPYQFVLPRSANVYFDMLNFLQAAQLSGQAVTVIGTGTCSVDFTVETVTSVTY